MCVQSKRPTGVSRQNATSVDLNADFRRATGRDQVAVAAQQKAQQTAATTACPQETLAEGTNEDAPENRGEVNTCQSSTTADTAAEWAIQGSNL